MNPAMIAGSGISLANQLKNLIMGAKQIKDGKKLQAKLDAQGQPILETPESFTEVEGLVRSNYVDPRFRGESKMRDAIESRGANQIQNIQQTAGSGMDALMAYNVANANTDNNLFNLDMKSFEQQQADYQSLLGMLGQKAQYEDKQWMQNVLTPFVQSSEQAKALIGAGQQNVNNAMNDMASTTMLMDGMFKKEGGGNPAQTGSGAGSLADPNAANMRMANTATPSTGQQNAQFLNMLMQNLMKQGVPGNIGSHGKSPFTVPQF